jgi:hypothetical protein
MLNVLLSFAQYERELTGERIRDKFTASRQKGLWMGGMPLLGYDIDDRKLTINEEEAKLVRRIFNRFLVLRSPTNLAKELNEAGYSTKQYTSKAGISYGGHSFTKAHLRRMLTNPIYKGYVCHKGETYAGQHEAIIKESLWDKVQAVFEVSPHTRARESVTSMPALLKNLIKCQMCDVPMTPTYTKKRSKQYRYYACSNHLRGKSCPSSNKTIAAGEIELFVSKEIRKLLKSPEVIAKTLTQLEQTNMSTEEAHKMLKQIDCVWDNLFPIEQQRIAQLLIKTIWVQDDGIDIRIYLDEMQSVLL